MTRVSWGISVHDPRPEPTGTPTYAQVAEECRQLRAQVVELAAKLDELSAANLALSAENAELRAKLKLNSTNSSKPPPSDGYGKPAPKSRRRSGKKPGKQPGTPGKNLAQIQDPDAIVDHVPDRCERCERCGNSLGAAPVTGVIRRQVFELPPVKVVLTKHRVERRKCTCGCETTAPFPAEATGPACYVLLGSARASTTSKIWSDHAVLEVISWPVHHSFFSAPFCLSQGVCGQHRVRRECVAYVHHTERVLRAGLFSGTPREATARTCGRLSATWWCANASRSNRWPS